jgi:hypothetical protein
MNSAAKAIAWDIWSRNRWALTAVVFGMPFLFIPGPEWLRVFQALFFMFAITILCWSFCYVEVDARGKHGGFPSRMFVLPLPTGVMAGLPMIYGACAITAFYLFWSQVVLPIWGVRLSPSWMRVHTLGLVAALISLQAIVWSLHRFPWIRLATIGIILIGTGVLAIVSPADDFRKITERQVELALAIIALLGFAGGIAGVARDRRGEWDGWTQRVIDRVLSWLPRRRSPFSSAADAQLWFEWRGKAMFLCFVLLIAMLGLLILWPVPKAVQFDGGAAASFYAALPFVTLCAAWSMGFSLAYTDYLSISIRSGLSSFVTARPMSSGDIVMAKLKAAGLVTITTGLLFAAFAVPVFNLPHWFLSSADHGFPSFSEFVRQNRQLMLAISHPVIILTALFVMWATMVDSLALGLKPRQAQLTQSVLKVAVIITALMLIAWTLETPRGRRFLVNALPWVAGLMIVWKVATTFAAMLRARRFYSGRQLAVVIALWLTTTLLLSWTAAILWTDTPIIDRVIVAFAAWLLPGAALARAPLNLDRSRHA